MYKTESQIQPDRTLKKKKMYTLCSVKYAYELYNKKNRFRIIINEK